MSEVQAGENKTAFYSYNEDSTVAAIKYANGINIDYFHDADKNISGILAKNAVGEELLNHSYLYDNNGNQTKRTEEGKSTSYIYDSLNRLSKVSYSDYTEVFSYDKAGNRVERNAKGLISQYSYDVRNRLTQIEEAGNFTSFEYDAQGNLLSEKSKQGVKAYTYDCFNRTASVTNSDGTYINNYYDPEGLRSEINENGDISRFIFDRGNVITELDGDNNLKASTIRGLSIVAQIDAERNSYYYLNNCHGDVTAITDAGGSIVNSYKYDAFGNTVEANEKIHNRFRYCGEQYDNVSSQYYLRARFYNPVVGRFTQEDAYRGDGLNLYAYVGNNPVNYSDPSGYRCHKGDLLFGSEWNDYFEKTYGKDNVEWVTKGASEPKLVEIIDHDAGTFKINDWSAYPDEYVPLPDKNKVWTFLEGDDYELARKQANDVNRNLRKGDSYYSDNRLEIHEVEPVKFGGSPTDLANKTAIQGKAHRRYVTPWWNKIRDEVKKGLNK